jgi:hypothetical protein
MSIDIAHEFCFSLSPGSTGEVWALPLSRKRHSHAPCGGTRSIGSHITRNVRSARE